MKKILKVGNLKILVREIDKTDLKRVDDFLEYINSLVEEDAMIWTNRKLKKREEKIFLKEWLKKVEEKTGIMLVAEDLKNKKIIGITTIEVGKNRESHVGILGITIRKEYRGMGLGKKLMKEIIRLSRKRLKIKLIRLSVFEKNKIAIKLYEKFGFKKVAKIPKQIQYKGELIDEIIMIKEL